MAKTKTKATTAKKAAAPKKKTVKKKAAVRSTVTKAKPKKKAVRKKILTKKQADANKIKVTHEQRHRMICEAAYYISLERTHLTVNPTEDWLKAEASIALICVLHDK